MKIYVLGRGHRLEQIREALRMSKLQADVISQSPETVTFEAVAQGDLIVVTEYEEAPLRAMLDNLARQKLPATVMVFTSVSTRQLARDYPDFLFRNDQLIYNTELRELQRRAAGRQKVEALRKVVTGAPLLTVIWGNPDPDAIACAYALHELAREQAASSTIAYMGEFTRPENAAMVNILKIPMRKFSRDLIAPETVVATVDAQPSFFDANGPARFDIVVDHHPMTNLGSPRFADVRPAYGSTSTIFTEYYQTSGTAMSRKVATALFYGLKIDTGNLTRNVSDADVAAFRALRLKADENMVRTIELSQLPVETLDFFAIAIANKKIARDLAFAWLGTIPNPDMCVHVADFFIKLTGISWVFIACRSKDKVIVVVRSDGFRKHAGNLAEALFRDFGTAGGHRTMARAELELGRLAVEIPEPADAAIEEWLMRRVSAKVKPLARSPR